MDNNFMVIILAFILGYMVKSMCGGRLVEGLGCNPKTQPRNQGYGTYYVDDKGNTGCRKCQEIGQAVGADGRCIECNGDNEGLDTDFSCKQYPSNYYYKANYTSDGEVNHHYEQSKKSVKSRPVCTQHGWGDPKGEEDDNYTCNPTFGYNNGYCMKKKSDTRLQNEQECSCWDITKDQANNGFFVEYSYMGGKGNRQAPEEYVQCSYNNI